MLNDLKWSTFNTLVKAIAQLIVAGVMSRLLDPTAFGIMAMANIILRFGIYFSKMGIGPAIVQKKEISKYDIRASFTSYIMLGLLMSLVMWFGAPLSLYIFNDKEIIPVIRWMSLSFVISGISGTPIAILQRNMKFKVIAVIEIISYLLGYAAIGLLFAHNGAGVWSLVAANLGQATLISIFSYGYVRHSVLPLFNWEYYTQLYGYGAKTSVISFFEFIGLNIDTFIVGKILGSSVLGLYSRIIQIINMPMEYMVVSFSRVYFPKFSKIQNDKKNLINSYNDSFIILGIIISSLMLGLSLISKEIIYVLLGPKWYDMTVVMSIVCIAVLFNGLSVLGGVLCDSTANLNIKMKFQFIYILIISINFYIFSKIGIVGVSIALLISNFIKFMSYQIIAIKILNQSIKKLLINIYIIFYTSIKICTFILLSVIICRYININKFVSMIINGTVGAISLGYFLLFSKNEKIRDIVKNNIDINSLSKKIKFEGE